MVLNFHQIFLIYVLVVYKDTGDVKNAMCELDFHSLVSYSLRVCVLGWLLVEVRCSFLA